MRGSGRAVATVGGVRAAGPNRTTSAVLTVPNLLSVVRLATVPVFLYLLFGLEDRAAAAWLLGAVYATDFLDGFLARRLGQVSEVGKVLDPVADRLVLLVGVVAILLDGSAPLWVGLLVLVREGTVFGLALVLAGLGAERIDVSRWGKFGTAFVMAAFPLWLGGESTSSLAPVAAALAWCFAVPGLVASYTAAVLYVPVAVRALRQRRARRAAGAA